MKRNQVSICWLAFMLCLACEAGIRGPGKYCGVVLFDRWGGCTLYSGIYVMYVSESVKSALRPYSGKAVQIDAKEVSQPMNPGDGLIKQFEYLGAAPEGRSWVPMEGVTLASSVRIEPDGKPVATLTVGNTNRTPLKLFSQQLALTVLRRRDSQNHWAVSDGPSFALITRQSFDVGGPRWESEGIAAGVRYAWTIGRENALPSQFTLAPGETKKIDVRFDLPDGQYDFVGGYGGGVHETKCTASNLSAFDIDNGKAEIVNIKRR